MTLTLILHVGPGKCGSSSIQRDLSRPGSPFFGQSAMLPAPLVRLLDAEQIDTAGRAQILALADACFAQGPVCVLSHEALFQRRAALANILAILGPVVDDIRIVGYSRRQSGFIRSVYSQWLFRAPERVAEIAGVVRDAGLDPTHFTGLERSVIAAVRTDMQTARQFSGHLIVDWQACYADVARLSEPFGAVVSAGFIPRPGYEFALLDNFYRRCGVPDPGGIDAPPANVRYDDDLVEAVNLAVQAGFAMPAPHQHSGFFDQFAALPRAAARPDEQAFLGLLDAYVDTYHWAGNRAFCRTFGLPEDYFRPERIVDRAEADAAIAREAARRLADPGIVARRNAAIAARLADLAFRHYLDRDGSS